ncbi:MAG TPA: hypothetical protein VFG68_14335 [Fimbriiglobus sp.]|nr:hypothetical protein [Fimbriiglobus sp.]
MGAAILYELFRPRGLDDFPGPFAVRARQVAEELRGQWERTSREAARTRTIDELHAARGEYHALLNGHLRLVEEYRSLTEVHQRVFGSDPAWAAELKQAAGELRKLYDELFPRWQTREDLTGILIDKFTLPNAALIALAEKHPPPPSWYDETDDPFAAE